MLILKISNHSPSVDDIQTTFLTLLGTMTLALVTQFATMFYKLGKIENSLKYYNLKLCKIEKDLYTTKPK